MPHAAAPGRPLDRAVLALAAVVLFVAIGRSEAQRVYTWKDERGVIHFADAPPKDGEFGVKDLPVPPAPPPPTPEAGTPAGTAPEVTPATPAATPADAEARVVIEEQSSRSAGDAAQRYFGRVKNVGGTEAKNVRVTIAVRETVQGADCLQDEIAVSPADLPPGETGTFTADFENPCFNGPTDAKLRPEWD